MRTSLRPKQRSSPRNNKPPPLNQRSSRRRPTLRSLRLNLSWLKRKTCVPQKLLANNATSKEDAETKERNVELAKASVQAAEASRQQAQLALESTIDGVNTSVIEAQERLKATQAAKQKAELAVSSTINGENTQVAQLRAQLATAQFNLAQTTVVAPSDGSVIGMTLQPGQRVAAFPVRTWMAFVDSSSAQIAVGIDQNRLRHVKPGQKADVVLELHPGRTFSATVDRIAYITPQGQLQPTGTVAAAPSSSQKTTAVRCRAHA